MAAAQIYNMMMEYPGNVTVKIDGIAASAASVIAMAGTKVLVSPVSTLMIHNPMTATMGDTTEMQKANGQPLGLFAETGGGTLAKTVTTPKPEDVIELIYALKRPYRKNASFIMNDAAIAAIRTFKDNNSDDGSSFEIEDLEIFENVAYIMAYHADHSIPATIEDWLDEFEMFSIYEVLPEILELWGMNLQTEIESKKNFIAVAGK